LPTEHISAMYRASWVGDTNKLCRASDAAFADYVRLKRVSGLAAIQAAIAELRARASAPRAAR
jgi:hypothetical protein